MGPMGPIIIGPKCGMVGNPAASLKAYLGVKGFATGVAKPIW